MTLLTLHPAERSQAPALDTLTVAVTLELNHAAAATECVLSLRVQDAHAKVLWPKPAVCQAQDGLWQHTCLEWFLRRGERAYAEFNYSPSKAYAHYAFSDYRTRAEDPSLLPPQCEPSVQAGIYQLRVTQRLPYHVSWDMVGALTVVIETRSAERYHWARKHAPARADFHASDSWLLLSEFAEPAAVTQPIHHS